MDDNGQEAPTKTKGRIVLFMPLKNAGNTATEQRQPLAFLSLAIPLMRDGYEVRIIDAMVDPDYHAHVLEACEGAICLGISAIAGYQVYCSGKMAEAVRERHPALPIVWGGWFSSIKPDFLLEGKYADVVVRGQGEVTFLELVRAFDAGTDWSGIEGLCYLADGRMVTNPLRPMSELDTFSPLPFDLIDVEAYYRTDPAWRIAAGIRASGRTLPDGFQPRILWHFASWGCPEQCRFCCAPVITSRRWVIRDPIRFADELEALVAKYRFNILLFEDANFIVNKKWMKTWCGELIRRKIDILWSATGEVKILRNWDDDMLRLLRRSGCYNIVMGVESANRETLKNVIRKNFYPRDTEEIVDRLIATGIVPMLTYIVAMPGESHESIDDTLAQCRRISVRHPEAWVYVNTFYPLPGTPLHGEAKKRGYQDPKTLEEWGIDINRREMLDHENYDMRKLHEMIRGFELTHLHGFERRWAGNGRGLGNRLLRTTSFYRMKYGLLRYPVEFKGVHLARRFASRLPFFSSAR